MSKLFSLCIVSLFVLTCVIFFITCKREYSYEGGNSNGTAVYTLNGAGGACAGSIVMGNYYAATSLGPTNTIQLQVNVTTIGTYSLSTNSTNGIRFSASGSFTNTGMQTITLAGSGTPLTDGNFTFTTPGSSGCFFTVTVNKATVVTASFTLAGAPNDCQDAVINGSYVAGVAMTIANTVVVKVNVTAIGAYTLNTATIDGISFSKSGTFTTTGLQNVMLVGTGTPAIPGNFTFTPLAGASSCTFQVSVLNHEPLAIYVLESGFGNPNPCIYTVSGSYIVNTPLSNSNTVSIHVYVTYIGNFTIATNTVNGMMFYYTGTFTSLGAQYVILTGTGTPLTKGVFTFIPQIVGPHPLGGQACAFVVTVN